MSGSTPPGAGKRPDLLAVDSGWSSAPPPAASDETSGVSDVPSGRQLLSKKAREHGTLLGVAPPQSSVHDVPTARIPIVVHAGVTPARPAEVAVVEALPVPVAPPSRRLPPALPTNGLVPERAPLPTPPAEVAPVVTAAAEAASSVPLSTRSVSSPALGPLVAPRATPARRPAEVTSLSEALKSRVRLASVELPLWSLLAPLMTLLLVGVAVGAAAGAWRLSKARLSLALAAPHAVSLPEQPVSLPAAQPAARDIHALQAKAPESLSSDEVLALAGAASERQQKAAKLFRERLSREPAAIKDKLALAELRKLTADPTTAQEALAAVAGLPGPVSADLLYEIWTATANRSDTTDLARALVYSRDVRAKASDALSVALELRQADSCPAKRALLARAQTSADRRSFPLLAKWKRKQGCAPNKKQDCAPCLQDSDDLSAAITAAKARPAPTLGPF